MSQKTKEILLAILALIVLVGLGFLVMKYVKLPGKKTNNNVINTEAPKDGSIVGKVVSIDNNLLKINDGKADIIVGINSKTIYSKNFVDPVESKSALISLEDIVVGDKVQIVFVPDPKETIIIAKSVSKMANSFKTGNIFSITNDKIIINDNITKEEYKFNLSEDTLYYKQIDAKPGESYQPDVIGFSDLKIGNLVIVFHMDIFDKDNITAEKILLVPQKEENK